MIYTEGKYYTDNSDLLVTLHKIYYRNDEYMKVKLSLTNKRNNIFYDQKNCKLYFRNIAHWKKFYEQ